MAWLHRHEGITAEGSGAVAVALVLSGKLDALATPAALVVSGRNVDPARLEEVLAAHPEV